MADAASFEALPTVVLLEVAVLEALEFLLVVVRVVEAHSVLL
jgi:hypothetical protein